MEFEDVFTANIKKIEIEDAEPFEPEKELVRIVEENIVKNYDKFVLDNALKAVEVYDSQLIKHMENNPPKRNVMDLKLPKEQLKAFIRRCKKTKIASKEEIRELEGMIPTQESDVQREIWDFLERIGCFPIKYESQGTFDPRTGMRRKIEGGTKRKGVSDLFFSVLGGLVVCEVKTPEKYAYIIRNWETIRTHLPKPVPAKVRGVKTKKVDDPKQRFKEQMEFIEKMKSLGHSGFFADSVQRVCIELLKNPHLLSPFQLQEVSRLAAESL